MPGEGRARPQAPVQECALRSPALRCRRPPRARSPWHALPGGPSSCTPGTGWQSSRTGGAGPYGRQRRGDRQPAKLRALPWPPCSLRPPPAPVLPALRPAPEGLADSALREVLRCLGAQLLRGDMLAFRLVGHETGAETRQRHYLFFCSTAKFFLKVGLIWLSSSTREWLRKRGLAGLGLK